LEKTIQVQELFNKQAQMIPTSLLGGNQSHHIYSRGDSSRQASDDASSYEPRLPTIDEEKVRALIEDTIRLKRLGEVTPLTIETSLADHTNHMLREMGSITEAMRIELTAIQRDLVAESRKQIEAKMGDAIVAATESR
jgi:hypothetical protein